MNWRELQVLAMWFTEDLATVEPAFATIDGTATTASEPCRPTT